MKTMRRTSKTPVFFAAGWSVKEDRSKVVDNAPLPVLVNLDSQVRPLR
jgi:hypothetical protein